VSNSKLQIPNEVDHENVPECCILAALTAVPAVAKSHVLQHNNIYSKDAVVENGRVVGADPDSRIRVQIRRDWNWYRLD